MTQTIERPPEVPSAPLPYAVDSEPSGGGVTGGIPSAPCVPPGPLPTIEQLLPVDDDGFYETRSRRTRRERIWPDRPANVVSLPFSRPAMAAHAANKLRRLASELFLHEIDMHAELMVDMAEWLEHDFSLPPPGYGEVG